MFKIKEYKASDGKSLRYGVLTDPNRTEPAKRAMLFVPGLGGSVKDALNFLERLLPAYDAIYAPDLRGFGLNESEELPHPDLYIDDLVAFQEELKLGDYDSLTLAGISLGGATATHLAVRQPDNFDNLLLIAPAYKASDVSFPLPYILKNLLGRLFGGSKHRTTLPYDVKALTRNPDILNDPAHRDQPPLSLYSQFLLQVSVYNFKALQKTRQIAIPTLMLVPGKDIICDPEFMRKGFRQIPESINGKKISKTLKEYPPLYHDVLMEPEAPKLANDVLRWVGGF